MSKILPHDAPPPPDLDNHVPVGDMLLVVFATLISGAIAGGVAMLLATGLLAWLGSCP